MSKFDRTAIILARALSMAGFGVDLALRTSPPHHGPYFYYIWEVRATTTFRDGSTKEATVTFTDRDPIGDPVGFAMDHVTRIFREHEPDGHAWDMDIPEPPPRIARKRRVTCKAKLS
jgi:hypothetical protein